MDMHDMDLHSVYEPCVSHQLQSGSPSHVVPPLQVLIQVNKSQSQQKVAYCSRCKVLHRRARQLNSVSKCLCTQKEQALLLQQLT